tara:strand:- start:262 stop:471 length:210 start_codon:yes stop_codon:yes gene_type:complete
LYKSSDEKCKKAAALYLTTGKESPETIKTNKIKFLKIWAGYFLKTSFPIKLKQGKETHRRNRRLFNSIS